MAVTGRPKKEINKEYFEGLCKIQCTEEEICDVLEVCVDTLNNWCRETYQDEGGNGMTFSKVFAIKRGKGRASLRRSQWNLAKKNPTMAIWLGKQYLQQSDRPMADGDGGGEVVQIEWDQD